MVSIVSDLTAKILGQLHINDVAQDAPHSPSLFPRKSNIEPDKSASATVTNPLKTDLQSESDLVETSQSHNPTLLSPEPELDATVFSETSSVLEPSRTPSSANSTPTDFIDAAGQDHGSQQFAANDAPFWGFERPSDVFINLIDVVPDFEFIGDAVTVVTDQGLPSTPAPATGPATLPPTDPPSPIEPGVTLIGSFGNDTLSGGNGDDVLDGQIGDDRLMGGPGDDQLLGGFGTDYLIGDAGDDFIFGGDGNDSIIGGEGNDELRGGIGSDHLSGGLDDDYLNGWTGDDTLSGGAGADTLDGGEGNDTYVISASETQSTDIILDADGDDLLIFDGLNPFEEIDGLVRSGDDLILSFNDGGTLTLDDFYTTGRIETFNHDGSNYATNADATVSVSFAEFVNGTDDQIITGTSNSDQINGGIGNDQIEGLGGNDAISGFSGDDELSGGDGNDLIDGGDGNDVLFGAGSGAFDFSGRDTLDGGAGADTLYGGAGHDVLHGGVGDDRLLGETGNDWADGGDGDDYIFGDLGHDTLRGGAGDDEIRGGFENDRLFGEADDDFLHGFQGNDLLDGGTGSDRMFGGDGNDTFVMKRGYGQDRITDFTAFSGAATYADTIDVRDFGLASFDDLVISQSGIDTLIDFGDGDSITLDNTNAVDLSAEDFSF
jgi:Ca2+-binding RTX toxin-like protein